MDRKTINNIMAAWQEVVEKKHKKMDPVGKSDADIDNDGDVDSSDEYLHNRRKAIKKSMSKEEAEVEEKKVCPKCDGEGCDHCDGEGTHEAYESSCGLKASTKGQILTKAARRDLDAKKAAKKAAKEEVEEEVEEGVSSAIKIAKKSSGQMTKAYKKIDKMKKGLADNPRVSKALQKANEDDDPCWDSHKMVGMKKKGGKMVPNCVPKEAVMHNKYGYGEILSENEDGTVDVLFGIEVQKSIPAEELQTISEKLAMPKKSAHGKSDHEGLNDKGMSAKAARDMLATVSKEDDEREAQSHVDAVKASRPTGQAAVRRGDNRKGDLTIKNPVKGAMTNTTGKEG